MKLKVVQLNLFKGKWLDEAINFLKTVKPDILTLQEVSEGETNFFPDKDASLFEILKKELNFFGVYHSDIQFVDSPNSKFGNAVFSSFEILESKVINLSTFRPVTMAEFAKNTNDLWSSVPRHMLDAKLNVNGCEVHAISVHGRRSPTPEDSEESIRQSEIMASHIKSLGSTPFIVGGDFNMTPDTQVIKNVEAVAKNLIDEQKVKQTLNPRLHFLGEKGFVVDYIFVSNHFSLLSVDVPQVDISDHLPVVAELEFAQITG